MTASNRVTRSRRALQTEFTVLDESARYDLADCQQVVEVVAGWQTEEVSGWTFESSAARNTMSDWETAGRVLVEARVHTSCMGIMRVFGLFFCGKDSSGSMRVFSRSAEVGRRRQVICERGREM